jgi:hypothetical protein
VTRIWVCLVVCTRAEHAATANETWGADRGSSRVFFFSVRACACALDVFSYVLWGGLGLQRTHVSTHALLLTKRSETEGLPRFEVVPESRLGNFSFSFHFSFFIPDKQSVYLLLNFPVPSRSVSISEATSIGVCDLIQLREVVVGDDRLLVMIQTFIHTVPTRKVR